MTGSWDLVFIIAAGANVAAAVLALAVLKPWRSRVMQRSHEVTETFADPAPRTV
jgi:OFA family oxalate/formate antiporter-like MFS transporter